jgi:hypothetical protein
VVWSTGERRWFISDCFFVAKVKMDVKVVTANKRSMARRLLSSVILLVILSIEYFKSNIYSLTREESMNQLLCTMLFKNTQNSDLSIFIFPVLALLKGC